MTSERRKAKIAMLQQGKTIEKNVAPETGFSPATIHSALSNTCTSRKVRQAIQNCLQIQLWPDVPLTARSIVFTPEDSIELSDERGRPGCAERFARQWERSLNYLDPGAVVRTGTVIRFTRPLRLSMEVVNGETRIYKTKTSKRKKRLTNEHQSN